MISSILDDMIEYPGRQKILFKTTINDFWKKVIRKLIAFIYKSNNLLNILWQYLKAFVKNIKYLEINSTQKGGPIIQQTKILI